MSAAWTALLVHHMKLLIALGVVMALREFAEWLDSVRNKLHRRRERKTSYAPAPLPVPPPPEVLPMDCGQDWREYRRSSRRARQ